MMKDTANIGQNHRIAYIDVARGMAIIAIILGHLGNADLNRVVFTFHVPIFYIISGFFISKRESFPRFVLKRARSLLVPYYVTSILIILLSGLRNILLPEGRSNFAVMKEWTNAALYGAGDTWREPFYVRGIGAIWFLYATFWGLILLSLIIRLPKAVRPFLAVGIPYFGYWSRIRFFFFPLSVQAGCVAVGFMYVGYLAKEYRENIARIPEKAKQLLMLVSFILWFSFMYDFKAFWLVHCNFGRGWTDILRAFAACWCVILIAQMLDNTFRHLSGWLAFIGKYSLLMLSLHIIELDVFPWRDLTDYFARHGLSALSILYLKIVLKLIWSIGLTVLLSRIRVVRRLFNLK